MSRCSLISRSLSLVFAVLDLSSRQSFELLLAVLGLGSAAWIVYMVLRSR
jgi:hypothetical protein